MQLWARRGAAPGKAEEAAHDVESRSDAVARFGPLVERCELDHDQVIMVCGAGTRAGAWDDFCLSRADRVLAMVGWEFRLDLSELPAAGSVSKVRGWIERLRGCDLVGDGVRQGTAGLAEWVQALAPAGTFALSRGDDRP